MHYGSDCDDNVAIGYYAMNGSSGSPSSGDKNVAVGYEALKVYDTAASNTSIGYRSGKAVTTGSDNTIVGPEAGDALTTGSNNIILGHDAAASAVTVSNEITLGDTAITKFRVPGLNSFEINDSGQLSGVASTANGTAGVRKITLSTSAASGGSDGDVWIVYTA